jgi:hypothetical protein
MSKSEKFNTVFEKLNLSETVLNIFSKTLVTDIKVSKSTMIMEIGLESPDIISKAAETSLRETILSEFRSLLGVEFLIEYNFPAEDVFGDSVDTEEIPLFHSDFS